MKTTVLRNIYASTKTRLAATCLFTVLSATPLISHAQENPACTQEKWENANSLRTWKEVEVVASALVSHLEQKKKQREQEGKSTDEATFGVFPKNIQNNNECDQGTIMLKALIHFFQWQGKLFSLGSDDNDLERDLFRLYALLIDKKYFNIVYYQPKGELKTSERLTLPTAKELLRFIENKGRLPTETTKFDIKLAKKIIAEYTAMKPPTPRPRPEIKEEKPDNSGYVLYCPPYYLLPLDFGKLAKIKFGSELTLKEMPGFFDDHPDPTKKVGSIYPEPNEVNFRSTNRNYLFGSAYGEISAVIGAVPKRLGIGAFYRLDAQESYLGSGLSKRTRANHKPAIVLEVQPLEWILIRGFGGAGFINGKYNDSFGKGHNNSEDIVKAYFKAELELAFGFINLGIYGSTDTREGILGGLLHIARNVDRFGMLELLSTANWRKAELVFDNRSGTRLINVFDFSTVVQIPIAKLFFVEGGYLFDSLGKELANGPHGFVASGGVLAGPMKVGGGYMLDPVFGGYGFLTLEFIAGGDSGALFIQGIKSPRLGTLQMNGSQF